MLVEIFPNSPNFLASSSDIVNNSIVGLTMVGAKVYISDTSETYIINPDYTLSPYISSALELKDATTSNRAIIDSDGNLHTMGINLFDAGIATGGSKTTIVDTSKNYADDMLINKYAEVLIGNIDYIRKITDNSASTIIIDTLPGANASTTIGAGENGVVTITSATESASWNDYTADVVNGSTENQALSAVVADENLLITLGTGYGDKSSTTIGSGDNGVVSVEVDVAGIAGNDYTIAVNASLATPDRALSSTLSSGDLIVLLATEGNAKANAVLGTGDNGVVTVEVDVAGTGGNAYTVVVTDSLTVQDLALDSTLVGNDLTVILATEGDAKAISFVGSGADGTVNIEVDAAGTVGNSYTVVVDSVQTVQDRLLSSAFGVGVLTVNLATEGNAKANTEIGSGDNGVVTVEVDAPGTDGNAYTIAVNTTVTTERVLDTTLAGSDLVILLATEGSAKANTTIGTGVDGVVTIEVDTAGTNGNAYTVQVVEGVGALDVTLVVNALVVTLAAGGSLASAIVTKINTDFTATFTATASGDGSGNITIAEAQKNFANGTNIVNTTANTATLIASEINTNHGATFTATASGDGTTNTVSSVVQKNFLYGTNKLKDSANTATLVAGSINDDTAGLTATVTGTGATPLTAGEISKSFANGTNKLHTDANTATLITARINDTHGATLTAVASGTGASSLIGENLKSFENGTNKIHTTANTATLIAARINGTHGALLTATASGTGGSSISSAVAEKNFTGGGLNILPDNAKNTATLVAGVVHALPEFTAVASGNGTTVITAEGPVTFTGGVTTILASSGCRYRIKSV